jgi:hypothetical protein
MGLPSVAQGLPQRRTGLIEEALQMAQAARVVIFTHRLARLQLAVQSEFQAPPLAAHPCQIQLWRERPMMIGKVGHRSGEMCVPLRPILQLQKRWRCKIAFAISQAESSY